MSNIEPIHSKGAVITIMELNQISFIEDSSLESKGRLYTNSGFLTTYQFCIEIFDPELFLKLAVDYGRFNLNRLISPQDLFEIFGDYHYIDCLDPEALEGSINVKKVDLDYMPKFGKFKKLIHAKMKSLSYGDRIDYEITKLQWSIFDLYENRESSKYYKAPITTLCSYHPHCERIGSLFDSREIFKYSEQNLYEDDPDDKIKIIEGLNSNTLKINHLYTGILPKLNRQE